MLIHCLHECMSCCCVLLMKVCSERERRLALRQMKLELQASGKALPQEIIELSGVSMTDQELQQLDREIAQDQLLKDLGKVLTMVKREPDAWPFEQPVTEEIAPGYHQVGLRYCFSVCV